jgi:branched-chain amino acid transport system substrate-binding protein
VVAAAGPDGQSVNKIPALSPTILLAAALLIYPLIFSGAFYLDIGVTFLLAAISASAWNIVGGYAGQVSVGHAMFFGLGAYAPLEVAKAANINVAAQIPYNANSSDVAAQVLQLKTAKPDAVIFISYTADTILYFKTMKNLDYLPPIIIGDDAGFSDPTFIPNVGDLAQGAVNRSAFDIGKPGSNSYIINQMFKAKYNRDLDDTSARWMQGFFVLADAINRAGSTEPDKIQAALKATNLTADQLMIGYRGVKFDETGQNTLSATYLIQLQGKQYVSVWPENRATAKFEYPMKGWNK